ncbi:hypothetical protein EKO27_g5521 [Xylaria grammica]|uniref:Uncharacterized protein n=1 Tax=Xylaria grammica TaxID=363999 RepID=A0A439D5B2_9PEZI|nr:hypothetical protein EKO27_g5521 [Xylaria grammica]
MSSSPSSAGPGKPSNSADNQPPNPAGAPPISPSDGFERPPPDFDPKQPRGGFLAGHGQGLIDPANEVDESVEDEIKRKIAELEQEMGGPVTDEEKERIGNKIRSLREGGWLESLKLELVGKDSVPIEYFNRIVAENESSIAKVAQITAKADRKNMSRKKSGDDEQYLENVILNDEINDLKAKLTKCQKRGSKLERKLLGLEDELQQERSKSQGLEDKLQQEKLKPRESAKDDDALAKCEGRADDLQRQLDSMGASVMQCRKTAYEQYEKAQSLLQQMSDSRQREESLKDEVRKLRAQNESLSEAVVPATDLNQLDSLRKQIVRSELDRANCQAELESLKNENRDLKNAATVQGQPGDPEGLRKRITELEADRENCNDMVRSLREENENLKRIVAVQAEPNDPEGLRDRVVDLLSEVSARDENIKALEALLDQARNAAPPRRESANELQARCAELRAQRDMYRDKWAQRVVANDASNLAQFWEAVENTQREFGQLYQGIERLGRILGLADSVLDTPAILDKIIEQIVSSVIEPKETTQLTILNLRTANSIAQIRIESLLRDVDRAVLSRTKDEVMVAIKSVNEQEVTKRVEDVTQAYRAHRGAILSHIFDARNEFLALAEMSGDRYAIEALVDQFLQATSLPRIS